MKEVVAANLAAFEDNLQPVERGVIGMRLAEWRSGFHRGGERQSVYP